jgi:asparagine synthase (glutamine-hydrolysing)
MCGIAGIYSYDKYSRVSVDQLSKVRDAMAVRGPDGKGLWISSDKTVALANRRLAIIDLSPAGAQPMANADGSVVVTFNGEIYNYRELRADLEAKGDVFASTSDTEVLLHLYERHGVSMLERLRGMFAFALWDARARQLLLARDPFGIKPLYFSDDNRRIRFSSQVKSLLHWGDIDCSTEPAGYVGFFLLGSVPDPFTLYRGVRAVEAGEVLIIGDGGRRRSQRFFSLRNEVLSAQESHHSKNFYSVEHIRSAIADSVTKHLVSDVPVAVFQSAGRDSSTITAHAAASTKQPLVSVTVGFEDFRGSRHDETTLAEKVANKYRTRHSTAYISRQNFEGELEKLLNAMDQPSIDGVNTYFVSKQAAQTGTKVALSGIGGDELFGGYASFWQVPLLTKTVGAAARIGAARGRVREFLQPIANYFGTPKYAGVLEYAKSEAEAYLLRRSVYMPWELDSFLPEKLVHDGLEALDLIGQMKGLISDIRSPRLRILLLEVNFYLRNQLLRDADWAGMAHSLEIRVPFVDTALYRAILPCIAAGARCGKAELARSPTIPLPKELLGRRKTGFSVPVREWLIAGTQKERKTEPGLRGWAKLVCSF